MARAIRKSSLVLYAASKSALLLAPYIIVRIFRNVCRICECECAADNDWEWVIKLIPSARTHHQIIGFATRSIRHAAV